MVVKMMSIVCCCFLQDFHEEHAVQAFRSLDKGKTGYISAKDFEDIMCSLKPYLLTPFTRENLVTVSEIHFEKKRFCTRYF